MNTKRRCGSFRQFRTIHRNRVVCKQWHWQSHTPANNRNASFVFTSRNISFQEQVNGIGAEGRGGRIGKSNGARRNELGRNCKENINWFFQFNVRTPYKRNGERKTESNRVLTGILIRNRQYNSTGTTRIVGNAENPFRLKNATNKHWPTLWRIENKRNSPNSYPNRMSFRGARVFYFDGDIWAFKWCTEMLNEF